jgi:hypothetical protein
VAIAPVVENGRVVGLLSIERVSQAIGRDT